MNFPIVIQINAVYKISTSELSLVKVETLWEGHNFGKVQLFWEGHKNLELSPTWFDIYLVNVKSSGRWLQIFVAFSEKLNFTKSFNLCFFISLL